MQLLPEVIQGKIGLELKLDQVSWYQHQQDLQSGKRDVAVGAFLARARERYAFISKPYRFEGVSLFHRQKDPPSEAIRTGQANLSDQMLRSYKRLGLVKGYYYGPLIEAAIENPLMQERIT